MFFYLQANSYQAIVITDGGQSYAVYTYNCQLLEWSGMFRFAVVGFNAFGEYFDNHQLSGFEVIGSIACENEPYSDFSNLVYEISLPGDVVQQLRVQCLKTHANDIERYTFPEIVNFAAIAQPCPCSIFQAFRDRRFRFAPSLDVSQGYCFYQTFPTLFIPETVTQTCCYSFTE